MQKIPFFIVPFHNTVNPPKIVETSKSRNLLIMEFSLYITYNFDSVCQKQKAKKKIIIIGEFLQEYGVMEKGWFTMHLSGKNIR